MQREQILYELQCLFWPARAKLIIYATDSLLTFHVSSLHPLKKRASILQLYLFHCLSFSIFSHGFERRRTCLCCYMCAPFSSHKFMHLFTFALPFFLLPFFSFFPFFIALFFSLRNPRLLTIHIPPYSPRVVVIMLILSTFGWCPLNVISGKISVFLSTDSQSTGPLTFKSHVPVFALLSPLIIVAVIKRNSFL